MVLYDKDGNLLNIEFSPPYGDGTVGQIVCLCTTMFSPPYGDGTLLYDRRALATVFSPPYGDSTLNISQNIVK